MLTARDFFLQINTGEDSQTRFLPQALSGSVKKGDAAIDGNNVPYFIIIGLLDLRVHDCVLFSKLLIRKSLPCISDSRGCKSQKFSPLKYVNCFLFF